MSRNQNHVEAIEYRKSKFYEIDQRLYAICRRLDRLERTETESTGHDFQWAMDQLISRKVVARKAWPTGRHWSYDGDHKFVLPDDCVATDWYVVEVPHDIKWAVARLREGKDVRRPCWQQDIALSAGNRHVLTEYDMVADDWEIS